MSAVSDAAEVKEARPAETVLKFVPAGEQAAFFKTLLGAVRVGDRSNLDFIAPILIQSADEDIKTQFLALLDDAIRVGDAASVVPLALRYPLLGDQLLEKAVVAISNVKSAGEQGQLESIAALSYLSFMQSTVSHLPLVDTHSKVLTACLGLLDSQQTGLSTSARDVVFVLMAAPDEATRRKVVFPAKYRIWDQVESLVTLQTNKHLSLLGYSLWVRWLLYIDGENIDEFVTENYWRHLIHGLHKGDAERRKLCLNIVKLTIALNSKVAGKDIRQRYERYCTVFETIVLGRYINQILECEKDLDFLATDNSLEPQWLYTLLASSLESQMQDSNRKFIGNWIMRSVLPPADEFVEFFRDSFLPWATQGQLFVSTLRRQDSVLRCAHGDRLAKFLRTMLKNHTHAQVLVDIVMDQIMGRRNAMFAYATVYLLEGVGDMLQDRHAEELTSLVGLPEVARDYVAAKASKPQSVDEVKTLVSRREILEQTAIEKCRNFNPSLNDTEDLWSDLDYLEYSKGLLMKISAVLFHPRLIERAIGMPSEAAALVHRLTSLQKIAETKTYLFAPLMGAIRIAVAHIPAAAEILQLQDFIVQVIENPPESTIDLMLEEATLNLMGANYEHYFGERPCYAFASFLDLVSRLRGHQLVISQVLHLVLQKWRSQKLPPLTVSPWKNTLQLQVLLLCLAQYMPTSKEEIDGLLEDLFHILSIEPLPRYRYLLEWVVVRLFAEHHLEEHLLDILASKDHHSNPKHLASLMKIGVILACRQESEEDFADKLATTFVPLAASSKIVIRHEAQWQVPLLMNHARARGWTKITGSVALTALDDYIRSMERFHDPPLERRIGNFDPATDHTITNLVQGCWFDLDQIEGPLTSRHEFLKLASEETFPKKFEPCMPLGPDIDRVAAALEGAASASTNGSKTHPRASDEVPALQTKGTANLARTLSDLPLHQSRANNVIVVGSLVDNPYNLGGLSRVSEIFGASALCLQNQNVLSNKDFISVSVSSHLHFPIVQLSVSAITSFLTEKKSEGFIVVGIEQTDRSLILGSGNAKLPEKVVLVVGSEKEGVCISTSHRLESSSKHLLTLHLSALDSGSGVDRVRLAS